MAHHFGTVAFTPAIKALQERYGSRRQYARMAQGDAGPDRLTEQESDFIAERDSFYMASTGATGWSYVQHRGGPKGFLKVIDDRTLAFADFRGNKQFVTTGNVATDNRVALILVDYPAQARLKILGRAGIFEGDQAHDWMDRLRDPVYQATTERAFIIHLEAFDWNCPQHITPRYTADQIQEALKDSEQRIEELERENKRLSEALIARGGLEAVKSD